MNIANTSPSASKTSTPTLSTTAFRMRRPDAVGSRAPHSGQVSASVEMGRAQVRQGARGMGGDGGPNGWRGPRT